MPPEPRNPLDPREWLRRARSNLARARAGMITSEVLYEDACFDAQQAAEKAIKAVLVKGQIPFPQNAFHRAPPWYHSGK
jgi:HEPN domain-containing protein